MSPRRYDSVGSRAGQGHVPDEFGHVNDSQRTKPACTQPSSFPCAEAPRTFACWPSSAKKSKTPSHFVLRTGVTERPRCRSRVRTPAHVAQPGRGACHRRWRQLTRPDRLVNDRVEVFLVLTGPAVIIGIARGRLNPQPSAPQQSAGYVGRRTDQGAHERAKYTTVDTASCLAELDRRERNRVMKVTGGRPGGYRWTRANTMPAAAAARRASLRCSNSPLRPRRAADR